MEAVDFFVDDVKVTPIDALHYKLPVKGFRVDRFAYLTDANYIPTAEKEKLKDLDVFILNALRKSKHISHFNLKEAIELIKELNPKKAYLTHISHLMGRHSEVEQELPENISLAYDGLSINL
jgi:phosphoribosyl 1,2-cyclic phosphate phosphodiesterase